MELRLLHRDAVTIFRERKRGENRMAIYLEKIEENNRKIAQLEKNIKRDTEKRKKLLEDNRILSYNALCERYNCGTQELLDIIMREHDQAEMLRASGVSENDLFDLCDKKSSENGKSSESDADEDQMSFYDNE